MTGRAVTLWFTFLSLTAAPGLHAEQQPPAAPPAGVAKQSSREVIQQKLHLVKMLLTQSTAIERAARSDDAAIKQLAVDTNVLYAKAHNAFDVGDTAAAEGFLNDVLRLITDASRLAPDPAKVEAEQRARYAEMLENVQGVQITYQEMRKGMPPDDKQLPVINASLERTNTQLAQAQALAKNNRYKEAISLLDNAYKVGNSDLSKLMGSAVMTYEHKFNSPAEEFDFEMARYRSYEELIPIAHAQLKPDEGNIKMSERFVQESRAERDAAKQQATGGDHQAAIVTLQGATKRLQAALRTLGLMTPE